MGGTGDHEIVRQILSRTSHNVPVSVGELTLNEYASLLKEADLLIVNDSSPTHIADAVGTEVVTLFGPVLPEIVTPKREGHIIITNRYYCSPCHYTDVCDEGVNQCTDEISVDELYEVILKVLD